MYNTVYVFKEYQKCLSDLGCLCFIRESEGDSGTDKSEPQSNLYMQRSKARVLKTVFLRMG